MTAAMEQFVNHKIKSISWISCLTTPENPTDFQYSTDTLGKEI